MSIMKHDVGSIDTLKSVGQTVCMYRGGVLGYYGSTYIQFVCLYRRINAGGWCVCASIN